MLLVNAFVIKSPKRYLIILKKRSYSRPYWRQKLKTERIFLPMPQKLKKKKKTHDITKIGLFFSYM